MKLGILGTAEIAFRRFLPALQKAGSFTYKGVASRTPEKGDRFAETFGGMVYPSYDALLDDSDIDAVYVPLPPALHYEWGRRALETGKHLLLEKPFTTSKKKTENLLALAEEKDLVVHENYMFLYHSQLAEVKRQIRAGELGDIRLYRISFGFPKRAEADFRYSKTLGGGALLDCGGYPIRLASELLGASARVVQANLIQPLAYEVDLYGNAVLQNDEGICAQISFGMDNAYQCRLEVWGSRATLIADRIFTAGADIAPRLTIRTSTDETQQVLPADDQFLHSIEHFAALCNSPLKREDSDAAIAKQAELVDQIRRLSK